MFSAVDTIFRQFRSSNREIVYSTLIWSKVRFLIFLLRPPCNKCVTFFSKGGITRHGKTAVSHFSYNKIGISRITKKLTFFARIINLTIVLQSKQCLIPHPHHSPPLTVAKRKPDYLFTCPFFSLVSACFQGYCHRSSSRMTFWQRNKVCNPIIKVRVKNKFKSLPLLL